MKIILYGSILGLLAVGFGAVPAWADLDQRCLSLCVNGGGNAAKCLPQCTYHSAQPATKSPDNTVASTHNVFEAPKPVSGVILLPGLEAKSAGPEKDYTCFNQCLHDGGQYDRCTQSCTKTTCPLGGGNCKGLLGGSPAPGTPR